MELEPHFYPVTAIMKELLVIFEGYSVTASIIFILSTYLDE